ncbi:hypothetical protein BC832DRAFT_364474 [Gaertneriomyces semiglobifer]|nr:hypothetical protein BC832DRAFT_364474 [Gaertneriomyces semiglobifer]
MSRKKRKAMKLTAATPQSSRVTANAEGNASVDNVEHSSGQRRRRRARREEARKERKARKAEEALEKERASGTAADPNDDDNDEEVSFATEPNACASSSEYVPGSSTASQPSASIAATPRRPVERQRGLLPLATPIPMKTSLPRSSPFPRQKPSPASLAGGTPNQLRTELLSQTSPPSAHSTRVSQSPAPAPTTIPSVCTASSAFTQPVVASPTPFPPHLQFGTTNPSVIPVAASTVASAAATTTLAAAASPQRPPAILSTQQQAASAPHTLSATAGPPTPAPAITSTSVAGAMFVSSSTDTTSSPKRKRTESEPVSLNPMMNSNTHVGNISTSSAATCATTTIGNMASTSTSLAGGSHQAGLANILQLLFQVAPPVQGPWRLLPQGTGGNAMYSDGVRRQESQQQGSPIGQAARPIQDQTITNQTLQASQPTPPRTSGMLPAQRQVTAGQNLQAPFTPPQISQRQVAASPTVQTSFTPLQISGILPAQSSARQVGAGQTPQASQATPPRTISVLPAHRQGATGQTLQTQPTPPQTINGLPAQRQITASQALQAWQSTPPPTVSVLPAHRQGTTGQTLQTAQSTPPQTISGLPVNGQITAGQTLQAQSTPPQTSSALPAQRQITASQALQAWLSARPQTSGLPSQSTARQATAGQTRQPQSTPGNQGQNPRYPSVSRTNTPVPLPSTTQLSGPFINVPLLVPTPPFMPVSGFYSLPQTPNTYPTMAGPNPLGWPQPYNWDVLQLLSQHARQGKGFNTTAPQIWGGTEGPVVTPAPVLPPYTLVSQPSISQPSQQVASSVVSQPMNAASNPWLPVYGPGGWQYWNQQAHAQPFFGGSSQGGSTAQLPVRAPVVRTPVQPQRTAFNALIQAHQPVVTAQRTNIKPPYIIITSFPGSAEPRSAQIPKVEVPRCTIAPPLLIAEKVPSTKPPLMPLPQSNAVETPALDPAVSRLPFNFADERFTTLQATEPEPDVEGHGGDVDANVMTARLVFDGEARPPPARVSTRQLPIAFADDDSQSMSSQLAGGVGEEPVESVGVGLSDNAAVLPEQAVGVREEPVERANVGLIDDATPVPQQPESVVVEEPVESVGVGLMDDAEEVDAAEALPIADVDEPALVSDEGDSLISPNSLVSSVVDMDVELLYESPMTKSTLTETTVIDVDAAATDTPESASRSSLTPPTPAKPRRISSAPLKGMTPLRPQVRKQLSSQIPSQGVVAHAPLEGAKPVRYHVGLPVILKSEDTLASILGANAVKQRSTTGLKSSARGRSSRRTGKRKLVVDAKEPSTTTKRRKSGGRVRKSEEKPVKKEDVLSLASQLSKTAADDDPQTINEDEETMLASCSELRCCRCARVCTSSRWVTTPQGVMCLRCYQWSPEIDTHLNRTARRGVTPHDGSTKERSAGVRHESPGLSLSQVMHDSETLEVDDGSDDGPVGLGPLERPMNDVASASVPDVPADVANRNVDEHFKSQAQRSLSSGSKRPSLDDTMNELQGSPAIVPGWESLNQTYQPVHNVSTTCYRCTTTSASVWYRDGINGITCEECDQTCIHCNTDLTESTCEPIRQVGGRQVCKKCYTIARRNTNLAYKYCVKCKTPRKKTDLTFTRNYRCIDCHKCVGCRRALLDFNDTMCESCVAGDEQRRGDDMECDTMNGAAESGSTPGLHEEDGDEMSAEPSFFDTDVVLVHSDAESAVGSSGLQTTPEVLMTLPLQQAASTLEILPVTGHAVIAPDYDMLHDNTFSEVDGSVTSVPSTPSLANPSPVTPTSASPPGNSAMGATLEPLSDSPRRSQAPAVNSVLKRDEKNKSLPISKTESAPVGVSPEPSRDSSNPRHITPIRQRDRSQKVRPLGSKKRTRIELVVPIRRNLVSAVRGGSMSLSRPTPVVPRRSSSRLHRGESVAPAVVVPVRPPSPTLKHLVAAVYARLNFDLVNIRRGWEKACREATGRPVSDSEQLQYYQHARKTYHKRHMGDMESLDVVISESAKSGGGLSVEKMREIYDSNGQITVVRGRKIPPPHPKRPVAALLNGRSNGALQKLVERTEWEGVVSRRLTSSWHRTGEAVLGSGHTIQLAFAAVPVHISSTVTTSRLILASAHFTDQTTTYNKPETVCVWDIRDPRWMDDNAPVVRAVGENDGHDVLRSHWWTTATNEAISSDVQDVAFSADGCFLFSVAAKSDELKVWDPLNASLQLKVPHRAVPGRAGLGLAKLATYGCETRQGIVAAAGYDGSVKAGQVVWADEDQWDWDEFHINGQKHIHSWRACTDVVFGRSGGKELRLFAGFERVKGGHEDGIVKMYREREGELTEEMVWSVGENAVACLALAPRSASDDEFGICVLAGVTANADGNHLSDGMLRLYDSRKPGVARTFQTGQYDHNLVGFSPCGRFIYSCSDPDDSVKAPSTVVIDWRLGKELGRLEHGPPATHAAEDGISAAHFARSGLLYTGGPDETVRVWDVRRGDPLVRVLDGHSGAVSSIAMNEEEDCLAVGCTTGHVTLWKLGEV